MHKSPNNCVFGIERSYNYHDASFALYGDDRILRDSDQLASDETIDWDVSFWYWSPRVHDLPGVAEGQFGVSIRGIHGLQECGPNAPS